MTDKNNIYYKHTYYKIVMHRKIRKRSKYLNRHMELALENRALPKIGPSKRKLGPFATEFLPVMIDPYRECLRPEPIYTAAAQFDTVYTQRKVRKNATIGLLSYVISVLDQLEA